MMSGLTFAVILLVAAFLLNGRPRTSGGFGGGWEWDAGDGDASDSGSDGGSDGGGGCGGGGCGGGGD